MLGAMTRRTLLQLPPLVLRARPLALLLWPLALLAWPQASLAQPAAPPARDFSTVDAAARAEMQAQNIPGAAIAIVQGDRVVYAKGYGVLSV